MLAIINKSRALDMKQEKLTLMQKTTKIKSEMMDKTLQEEIAVCYPLRRFLPS